MLVLAGLAFSKRMLNMTFALRKHVSTWQVTCPNLCPGSRQYAKDAVTKAPRLAAARRMPVRLWPLRSRCNFPGGVYFGVWMKCASP